MFTNKTAVIALQKRPEAVFRYAAAHISAFRRESRNFIPDGAEKENYKKYAKKLSFFYIFHSISCCKRGKKIV